VTETTRRRPGRPATISRAAILETAAEIDIEDLTLPDLASRLGVTRSALYNYFPSKRDLVIALIEHLADAVVVPPRDDRPWQEWIIDAAVAMRDFIERAYGPNGTRASAATLPVAEAMTATLFEAGFTRAQARDLSWHLHSLYMGCAAMSRRTDRYGPYTQERLGKEHASIAMINPNSPLFEILPESEIDLDGWFRRQVAITVEAFEQKYLRA
jgi:AcrR family transcriptional regulator